MKCLIFFETHSFVLSVLLMLTYNVLKCEFNLILIFFSLMEEERTGKSLYPF